jgi:polyisoprenoid-binding protein YceI
MTATKTETTWKLDPSHTSVAFSAKHLMFTTVKGRFADVDGTVVLGGESAASATVRVIMKAASIDTRTEQRDAHLRSPDFLDADNFPLITFVSTRIDGTKSHSTLRGDLTIRGVTRPVTLDVRYEGSGTDPWGVERMGFSAFGKLDRRDFGLVWNQALETGGVLVGNDVKVEIDAQFIKAA